MSRPKLVAGICVGVACGLFAVAGCGSGTVESGGEKVVFVPGVAGDEFYITMGCAIKAEADELGVSVETQAAKEFDPAAQRPVLDSVISSRPDAILVAPTDTEAMQRPLERAAEQGIEVVLVDTTVNDPSFAASQVASDNVLGGEKAFEAMQKLQPKGGKLLTISVDPGISTTDARSKGFKTSIEDNPQYEDLGVQYSHDSPEVAAKRTTAALQKDPDLAGIFGANLFSAEGAATGVRQAGKEGQVSIVGFDAGPAQVKDLKNGVVDALVAQQPDKIGRQGLQQAVASLKGEDVEKEISTGFTIVTRDNVDGAASDALYKSHC